MQEILKRLFIKIRDCYPKQILGVPQRGISLHEVQSALCETSKYLTLSGLGKGRFRRFSFAGTSPEVFKAMEIKFTRSVEYRRDIELFRFGTEDERNDLFYRVETESPYMTPEAIQRRQKRASEKRGRKPSKHIDIDQKRMRQKETRRK
jgi:hypothetical protein